MYLCIYIQLIPPFPFPAWVSPTKCGLKRGLPSLHMASPGVITYAVTQVWVDPPKIHMEPQKSPLPEGKSSSKNGFFWVLALCFQVLIASDEPPWLVYQHIQRGTSSNGKKCSVQLCLHRSVGFFVPLKPYRLRVCLYLQLDGLGLGGLNVG